MGGAGDRGGGQGEGQTYVNKSKGGTPNIVHQKKAKKVGYECKVHKGGDSGYQEKNCAKDWVSRDVSWEHF